MKAKASAAKGENKSWPQLEIGSKSWEGNKKGVVSIQGNTVHPTHGCAA